jgi:hypothetical protein
MIAYCALDRDSNDYVQIYRSEDEKERCGCIYPFAQHLDGRPDLDTNDKLCKLIARAINTQWKD